MWPFRRHVNPTTVARFESASALVNRPLWQKLDEITDSLFASGRTDPNWPKLRWLLGSEFEQIGINTGLIKTPQWDDPWGPNISRKYYLDDH